MTNRFQMMGRRSVKVLAVAAAAALCCQAALAQVAPTVDRMAALVAEKESRTAAQQKIGSQLWYSLQASRGRAIDGLDSVYDSARSAARLDSSGLARVKIVGSVSDALLGQIAATGGKVLYAASKRNAVLAAVPLASLEVLAGNDAIKRISMAAPARTNVGAVTSQGYIAHKANQVIAGGHNGSGVTVGVISDSVESLAALIATGDLPADAFAIPGQDGAGLGGESEGTAMMEIIHDLAPGAKLIFATAFNSEDSFADNIRMLRDVYHCDIIVDDVSYFDEAAFQDSEVALAVNDVTASGALYFSAAANSGNLTSGTSGTWEGDFNPGSASAAPLPAGYTLHRFTGTQDFNRLTASTVWVGVHWSDEINTSSNDYDLFLLNAAGTVVLCSSTDIQAGAGYPLEACYNSSGWPVNTRIVIGKKASAAPRAIHVDTERGTLSVATSGATFGHNAALNTVGTAAVYWGSAKTGTKPFVGGASNPTETFSSDGPRKIFYQPDGTPITPGNFLFSTSGGSTLNKPDLSAADGVTTKTPGFNPFFGTSAAAPHAAAVAALIKSARPDYTNAQILAAMKATALDIRAAGIDRDSGVGITMAQEAVNYALTH